MTEWKVLTMGKLFDLDSPLIRVLNKAADLMWLNILVMICSLPIFTAGAALTSAHYVALKMWRNEESYITKEFFKAFKMNFKQATLIWLILLLVAAVLGVDFYLIQNNTDLNIPEVLQVLIMAAGILFLFLVVWVFPVQAKFINTIPKTMKNAFALAMIQLPKTLLMIIVYALPWVILSFTLRVFPLVFVFGISAPVFVSAILYNKMFKKLEDKILGRNEEENPTEEGIEEATGEDVIQREEDEHIFSDKPLIEDDEKH